MNQSLVHLTADEMKMAKEDKKLEFVGDAVIALSIRLYFVHKYPELRIKSYGEVVSQLCSNTWLTHVAILHNMTPLGGHRKGLANRFEAYIAEIFNNYGFDAAKCYIWGILEQHYKPVYDSGNKKFIWK